MAVAGLGLSTYFAGLRRPFMCVLRRASGGEGESESGNKGQALAVRETF